MNDISCPVIEATRMAGWSFSQGELAYLALTSKIERPFLDRFSFALHHLLINNGMVVARELKVHRGVRADIAVLRDDKVTCVIEGKAMAVADCTRPEPKRREYADLLQSDLSRYEKIESDGAAIYCLLLGVHPLEKIPDKLHRVVKYPMLFNWAFDHFGTAQAIYADADRNLRGYLREEAVLGAGVFVAGETFGIPVELRWWCFGPFRGPADLDILRRRGA